MESSSTPATSTPLVSSEPMDQYQKDHQLRFQLSAEWLAPIMSPVTQVLELGGTGIFKCPGSPQVTGSVGDLRYTHPAPSLYDVVLCMEVLEHINDRDAIGADIPTEWRGDGVSHMLHTAWHSLKKGGHLFLTTPNASSITCIYHALNLRPGVLYRPHVREYSVYEVDELVRDQGFEIVRRETHDVWRNAINAGEHDAIREFIQTQGYPDTLRGEDIFLLARKP